MGGVVIFGFLADVAASSAPAPKATASATLNPLANQQLQQLLQHQLNPSRSPIAVNAPWLTHTFAALFLISAVLLIVLLAMQTTKQEGLSGTIGGRMESAYRGRFGGDAQIARLTTYVAIGFIFFGTLLSFTGI
jgi:preprotein translocase subunit SecG